MFCQLAASYSFDWTFKFMIQMSSYFSPRALAISRAMETVNSSATAIVSTMYFGKFISDDRFIEASLLMP